MRDALSLLDQAIAHGGGAVTEASVRAMLGTVDQAFLQAILEGVAAGNAEKVLSLAEEMRAGGATFDGALQELGTLLHRVALAQVVPGAADLDEGRLSALARTLDPEDVQLYYQIVVQGRQDLPYAPDDFAGFSMALLRMLAFTTADRAGVSGTPPPAAADRSVSHGLAQARHGAQSRWCRKTACAGQ